MYGGVFIRNVFLKWCLSFICWVVIKAHIRGINGSEVSIATMEIVYNHVMGMNRLRQYLIFCDVLFDSLFLFVVQHVHTQPTVTNVRSTKLIPNRTPRPDVALDELVPCASVDVPGWIQEPVSKDDDVVEVLVLSLRVTG